jgi:hypothetical protein
LAVFWKHENAGELADGVVEESLLSKAVEQDLVPLASWSFPLLALAERQLSQDVQHGSLGCVPETVNPFSPQ